MRADVSNATVLARRGPALSKTRCWSRAVCQFSADLQKSNPRPLENGATARQLFTRRHLPVYLQALAAAGLTPRVREGLKLAASRVVQHLHNLARALVRPQDELAWAALLRGPGLRNRSASWSRRPRRPVSLAGKAPRPHGHRGLPGDLATLIEQLLAALAQVGRQPLGATIGQWLDAAAAWSGITTWEGAMGVACARAYLELLAQAESGLPETTFAQADFNLPEAFQPPDPQAQDSPVEILTVHGAKGLEFTGVSAFSGLAALAG